MSMKLRISNGKTAIFECETRGETFQKMQHFFKHRKFCDVVLIAGNDGTRVSAHRIVISAASEYLLDLLETSSNREITLDNVDGDILQMLVNFIYTAKLEIRGDTVDNIMRTANILKLESVITECSDYLASKLCHSNCLPVAVFSQERDYPDLCEKAFMYACEHFTELFTEESFLKLDVEQLCKILCRSDICVRSEEDVFHGIMVWIQHDRINREQFAFKLLSFLRFPLLKPQFIASDIEEACQSPECQSLIIKAFKWHMTPGLRNIFPPELCEERNKPREMVLIKKSTDPNEGIILEIFDPLVSRWTSQEWPSKLSCFSNGVVMRGKVYLAGLTVQENVGRSSIHCMDLATQEWSELPTMTQHRTAFGMAELNGLLYAVGGTYCGETVRTIEKWDPNSPLRWQEVAPMRYARSNPAVAALYGLLYVLGMGSDKRYTFEVYDPITDMWAELTPPAQPRDGVKLAAVMGHLYAIGSKTRSGNYTLVECYDPNTDTWKEIPPSEKFQRYTEGACSLNRLIVSIGTTEGRQMHILEEYNPELNTWRTLNPLTRFHGEIMMLSK